MLACVWVLSGLRWQTWIVFGCCVSAVLVFYLFWGRHHSALNAGGADGYIPTAVPGDDDVMFVEEPKDHHFLTSSPQRTARIPRASLLSRSLFMRRSPWADW